MRFSERFRFHLQSGQRAWSRARDFLFVKQVPQAAKNWLKVTPLQSPVGSIAGAASRKLHRGEVEVIQLGEQLRADVLLIDDRSAVLQARAMGFRVVPTIAVYIQAKRAGLVPSIKRRVDQMRDSGFRLTDGDYEAVLIAAGEV